MLLTPFQEYKKVLDLIQSNILDTDIATHLRKMKDMQQMGKGKLYLSKILADTYIHHCGITY